MVSFANEVRAQCGFGNFPGTSVGFPKKASFRMRYQAELLHEFFDGLHGFFWMDTDKRRLLLN
jgi:hypothetical protein